MISYEKQLGAIGIRLLLAESKDVLLWFPPSQLSWDGRDCLDMKNMKNRKIKLRWYLKGFCDIMLSCKYYTV